MKKVLSLLFLFLSVSLFSQAFEAVDTHFLGMTEQEFMQKASVSKIETNNDVLNDNFPHFSYSDAYTQRGRKISIACGYDDNGKINIVAELIPANPNNPAEFATMIILYSQVYVTIGKENENLIWFRNNKGSFAVVNNDNSIIVVMLTHDYAKKIGLNY